MRIGAKPGQWGWSFEELAGSWQAAEEAGFDLIACFDHVTASPRSASAWNAPTLLAAMAGRTQSVTLAVRVVNVCLRHPFLLAAEVAVAQEASGGRLDVGLGAGSFGLARYDHEALGIPFPAFEQRTARLDAACRVLPALWRGEAVDDESLGLRGASLGPIDISVPPLTVGGESASVVHIAARYAQTWNLSTPDPGAFTKGRQDLERGCEEEGRRSPIMIEAQIWARDLWTDARSHVRAFQDAGVDTVIIVLDEERGPDEVRRLADRVL